MIHLGKGMNHNLKNQTKEKKKSPLWLKVVAVIVCLVAIAAIVITARIYRQYLSGTKEMNQLRQSVVVAGAQTGSGAESTDPDRKGTTANDTTADAAAADNPAVQEDTTGTAAASGDNTDVSLPTCAQVIDFKAAHETNEDIYAWITVPGTSVDHPILQSYIDDYYLMRNLDNSDGYPGCLYTNFSCNNKVFTDNLTVVYGHNMPSGLMFTSLHNFEDQDVFNENETFTVYTEDYRFTYELIAAVWYNDDYIPYYYDTKSGEGVLQFWNSVLTETDTVNEPSRIRENTEVTVDDKLCVLSTCCRKNGSIVQGRRYLVIGKLIETAVYE